MKVLSLSILATLLLEPLASPYAADQPNAARPNFIVIFIDDFGYANIAPFARGLHKTPNLDRMAREGQKFTNFYVASSVCTPFVRIVGSIT